MDRASGRAGCEGDTAHQQRKCTARQGCKTQRRGKEIRARALVAGFLHAHFLRLVLCRQGSAKMKACTLCGTSSHDCLQPIQTQALHLKNRATNELPTNITTAHVNSQRTGFIDPLHLSTLESPWPSWTNITPGCDWACCQSTVAEVVSSVHCKERSAGCRLTRQTPTPFPSDL